MDVLNVIGLAVGFLGLALAAWAELKRREEQRDAAELAAASERRDLEQQRQTRLLLEFLGIDELSERQSTALDATAERRYAVGIADINNDGRDELLVASPWGPHSSMLHIFGHAGDTLESFGKLGEIGSGTPAGFTVGDLDGDGDVEVATIQPDGDDPYALGTRGEVLYRWDGRDFAEVAEHPLPRPGEPGALGESDAELNWHDGWSVLTIR